MFTMHDAQIIYFGRGRDKAKRKKRALALKKWQKLVLAAGVIGMTGVVGRKARLEWRNRDLARQVKSYKDQISSIGKKYHQL